MINIMLIFLIICSFFILLDILPILKIFLLIIIYILGSLLMVKLDNPFLGLTYIIIYVGAIAILFLFIIMMMNIQNNNNNNIYRNKFILYILFLFILIFLFFNEILLSYINNNLSELELFNNIQVNLDKL